LVEEKTIPSQGKPGVNDGYDNRLRCAGTSPKSSPFATPGMNVIESPAQFHVGETARTVEYHVRESFEYGVGFVVLPVLIAIKTKRLTNAWIDWLLFPDRR